MATWFEPGVELEVLVSPDGPYDPAVSDPFDVTSFVRGDDGITISRGRSDEFSDFQPATCSFVLNNNAREFDPENPSSQFASVLRPRSRVEVKATSRFAHGALLTGSASESLSTPDTIDLDLSGLGADEFFSVDIRLRTSDWTPGGFGRFLVAQWPNDDLNDAWRFTVSPAGELRFTFTTDGTTEQFLESTVPTGFADGSLHNVGMIFWPDFQGAGTHRAVFLADGALLGSAVTGAGAVSLFNSTADLTIGDILVPDATVHRTVINSSNGVLVANDIRPVPTGVTSYEDQTGRTWTVNGTAEIVQAGIDPEFDDTHTLFIGFVEGWPQTWRNRAGTVEVTAQDRLSIIANDSSDTAVNALRLDDPATGRLGTGRLGGRLPQQFSGERVTALLSLAGFDPSVEGDLDTGLVQMAELQAEGNVLQAIQETERSEAGFFYVAKDGRFRFLDRHSRFLDTRLRNVQATFDDDLGIDPDYTDLAVEHDLTEVFNDIRWTRDVPQLEEPEFVTVETLAPGGTASAPNFKSVKVEDLTMVEDEAQTQTARDADSIRLHGRRPLTESGPLISDAEALGRAEFLLRRFKDPLSRPSPVKVLPRRDPETLFPQVLRLELLDRLQVNRTPLGILPTSQFVGLAQQIGHHITDDQWETTADISLPEVEDGIGFLRLDDTTAGQLDNNTLAF